MIALLYSPDTILEICCAYAKPAARRHAHAQDADDIAQDAAMRCWAQLAKGRHIRDLHAYAYRVVQRRAVDYGRADRRRPAVTKIRDDDTPWRAAREDTPTTYGTLKRKGKRIPLRGRANGDAPDRTLLSQQRLDLDGLVAQLPPRERDAVRAHRVGESIELLAEADGVSVRSVHRRVQRATCRMRAIDRKRDNGDWLGV